MRILFAERIVRSQEVAGKNPQSEFRNPRWEELCRIQLEEISSKPAQAR